MVVYSPWRAVLAGRVQVLLHALIVVNLCGHWNGHGLSVVTTVTQGVFRRPAASERKKGGSGSEMRGRGCETAGQREQRKKKQSTVRCMILLIDKINTAFKRPRSGETPRKRRIIFYMTLLLGSADSGGHQASDTSINTDGATAESVSYSTILSLVTIRGTIRGIKKTLL